MWYSNASYSCSTRVSSSEIPDPPGSTTSALKYGTSLVLRSDSLRRDVERVLQLTDLELAFAFVRCPDDLPKARGVSSLEGSYAAIIKRLDSLGVEDRSAIECTTRVVDVARRLIETQQSGCRVVAWIPWEAPMRLSR